MKSALLFTVVAALSTPVFAQSIATPVPARTTLTAATAKILNDQDADTAAAADIARVRPSAEVVGTVEIPASQIDAVKPSSMAAGVTAQPAI